MNKESTLQPDLTNRVDIEFLLQAFYKKVLQDDTIGFFFTEIAQIDMDTHMPRLVAFWHSVLFHEAGYRGNPILTHIELNRKASLETHHFQRWILLFEETLDAHFSGPVSRKAKEKARAMVLLMKMKIADSQRPGFIQ